MLTVTKFLSPSSVELTDKQHTLLMALQDENWEDTLGEDMDPEDSDDVLHMLSYEGGELDEFSKMQNHIFERWEILPHIPYLTI